MSPIIAAIASWLLKTVTKEYIFLRFCHNFDIKFVSFSQDVGNCNLKAEKDSKKLHLNITTN